MSTSQKVRVPNFTVTERARLMNIIATKHASIIEDKKTDRASSVLKEKAWQAIENEFNASSINVCRSSVALKKCYENRKKELRKSLAEERKETMLTGGGPPPKIKKDETDEVLLSILNKKTLMGIHNPYDDDADESVIENQKTHEVIMEYVNADVLENRASTSQTMEEMQSMDSDVTEHWKNYTPVQLQTPVSAPLVPSENKVTPSKSMQRRRPATVIKPMTSSNIAKKYDLLLDKRLQIVDTQLSHIKMENELKIKKLKLETEILEIELANKRANN